MVDPPAAEPTAVGLLLGAQVVDRSGHHRIRHVPAQMAQGLDHVGRHVGRRWIQGLAEVAEGNLPDQGAVVVHVKGRPGSIAAAHPQKPEGGPLQGPVHAGRVCAGGAQARQGHHGHGGVVDVGIGVVLILEGPAARRDAADLDLPVPGGVDLLSQQVVQCHLDRGVLAVQSAIGHGHEAQHGVPDR